MSPEVIVEADPTTMAYHVTYTDGVKVTYDPLDQSWSCSCALPECPHVMQTQLLAVSGKVNLGATPKLAPEFGALTFANNLIDRARAKRDAEEVSVPDGANETTETVEPEPATLSASVMHEAALEALESAQEELQKVAVPLADINEAILAVWDEVGYVQKKFVRDLGYSFAGEQAIINALRPALVRYGITFFVSKQRRRKVYHYASKNQTPMTNVSLELQVTFLHGPSGTKRKVWAWGEGADSGDKATPKAMTGALKYALRQTFGLETGDDPDNTPSRDLEGSSGPTERETRAARRDVLNRAGRASQPGDTPSWWQWFIKTRNDLGLTGKDLEPVLLKACTPANVSDHLNNLPERPETEEDIAKALNALLSRAVDWKSQKENPISK